MLFFSDKGFYIASGCFKILRSNVSWQIQHSLSTISTVFIKKVSSHQKGSESCSKCCHKAFCRTAMQSQIPQTSRSEPQAAAGAYFEELPRNTQPLSGSQTVFISLNSERFRTCTSELWHASGYRVTSSCVRMLMVSNQTEMAVDFSRLSGRYSIDGEEIHICVDRMAGVGMIEECAPSFPHPGYTWLHLKPLFPISFIISIVQGETQPVAMFKIPTVKGKFTNF